MSVMDRISRGAQRGSNVTFNDTLRAEFEAAETKSYRYHAGQGRGRRLLACVDLYGDIDGEKIAAAVKRIRSSLDGDGEVG